MKKHITLFIALCFCLNAIAQETGSYTKMEVNAGLAKINFKTGGIEELSGDVEITLHSDDPNEKPMPIKAQTMTFSFDEGETQPSRMVMDGAVSVRHADATITAGHGVYNLKSGSVVFSGGPYIVMSNGNRIKGTKITINMSTGESEIEGMQADEIDTQALGGSGPADPALLRDIDVLNWDGFITAFKADNKSDQPTPGKQIAVLLDASQRQALPNASNEQLLGMKANLLKLINKNIENPKFYLDAAWEGKTISEAAQNLLVKANRSPEEGKQMNRLLLDAAYPGIFKSN